MPRAVKKLESCIRPKKQCFLRKQGGAALIIGLIMLLVLTMIGLTGMQTTTMQERMSGNMRDRNAAFQAAELALRRGERDVIDELFSPSGNGYFDVSSTLPPFSDDYALSDDATWTTTSSKKLPVFSGTAVPPSYMVVKQANIKDTADLEAGTPKDKEVYKVNARGVGTSETGVVVLQSTFMPF